MFEDLNDLYQQVIMDHSKSPRNFHKLDSANRVAQGKNPLCGDNFTVYLLLENNLVKDISFEGKGCAISKASASMMTDSLKGKSKEEAEKLFHEFHGMLSQGHAASESLGKLAVFSGVNRFPARVKCATLAWHAVAAALDNKGNIVSTE